LLLLFPSLLFPDPFLLPFCQVYIYLTLRLLHNTQFSSIPYVIPSAICLLLICDFVQ
jgi:hypothetical protein